MASRASPVMDQFAELISLEYRPADAAQIMGYARSYGKNLMKRLRKSMGAQAI